MRKLLKTVATIVSLGLMWPAIAQAEEPVWRYHPDNDKLPGHGRGLYQLENRLLHVRSSGLFLSRDGGITWAKLEVEGMRGVDQFVEFKGRYFITEGNYYTYGYSGIIGMTTFVAATGNVSGETTAHIDGNEPILTVTPRIWVSDDGLLWDQVAELETEGSGNLVSYGETLVLTKYSQDNYQYTKDGISWKSMEKPPGQIYAEGDNLYSTERKVPTSADIYGGTSFPHHTVIYKLSDAGEWVEVTTLNSIGDFKKVGEFWFYTQFNSLLAVSADFENWTISDFRAKGVNSKIYYKNGFYNFYSSSPQSPVSPEKYNYYRSQDGLNYEEVVVDSETAPEGYYDNSQEYDNDYENEVTNGEISIRLVKTETNAKKYQFKEGVIWKDMSFDGVDRHYTLYTNDGTLLNYSSDVFITYFNNGIYYYTEKDSILLSPVIEVTEITNEQVTLNWQDVQGSEKYEVYTEYYYQDGEVVRYRSKLLATTSETTFTDTDFLENAEKKYYVVPVAEGKIGMASRKVSSYRNYGWCGTPNPDMILFPSGTFVSLPIGLFDQSAINATTSESQISFPVVKIEKNATLGPVEVQYAPWVWSDATGWAYAHPEEEAVAGQFFYVGNVGWVWSDASLFPFVYDFSAGEWVWVAPWSGRPWFELRADGTVIEVQNPVNRSIVK